MPKIATEFGDYYPAHTNYLRDSFANYYVKNLPHGYGVLFGIWAILDFPGANILSGTNEVTINNASNNTGAHVRSKMWFVVPALLGLGIFVRGSYQWFNRAVTYYKTEVLHKKSS